MLQSRVGILEGISHGPPGNAARGPPAGRLKNVDRIMDPDYMSKYQRNLERIKSTETLTCATRVNN